MTHYKIAKPNHWGTLLKGYSIFQGKWKKYIQRKPHRKYWLYPDHMIKLPSRLSKSIRGGPALEELFSEYSSDLRLFSSISLQRIIRTSWTGYTKPPILNQVQTHIHLLNPQVRPNLRRRRQKNPRVLPNPTIDCGWKEQSLQKTVIPLHVSITRDGFRLKSSLCY